MESIKYDFSGWATKNDITCTDGRIIRKDAFAHCDGLTVPLVWNHDHSDPFRVVGHVMLENRPEGVYAYGSLNDSDLGKTAKVYIQHGDITSLSIYANQLKQQGPNVMHGTIREVSLVLAGANPGACIENVIKHSGDESEDEFHVWTGEDIDITPGYIEHSEDSDSGKEDKVVEENKKTTQTDADDKTIKEIYDEMSEEQKTVVHAMVGMALEEAGVDSDEDEDEDDKEEDEVKHNVFDNDAKTNENVLTHADQQAIINIAKSSSVGSFREALNIFAEENDTLAHGFENTEEGIQMLFPELHNINPGAPEILRQDQSWVAGVISKIHKSPYSRIRMRQADARIAELKAKGYQRKGDQKKLMDTIKMLSRTFDPQTVYIKDEVHRDDIIDITDFSYVDYIWSLMKDSMNETLALAALVGDNREDSDPDKIHETHIRSIWNDDELYTIHADVDIEKARQELQGSNTSANFSENYIYAEAIIMQALYAREKFKGSGTPDLYCAPHLINVMLLARDLNGRRIYDSKADLAKALNVGAIHEIEQLEGRTREDVEGNTKKLLGLFVNLSDYQFGCTKGGELTKFEDFDIDFNKHKYLLETRLSGALTKPYAAIALEEPVEAVAG